MHSARLLVVALVVSGNLLMASAGRHHRQRSRTSSTAATATATRNSTAASTASTVATQASQTERRSRESPGSSWLGAEFMLLRRIYDDCQETPDFGACLKQKAVTALTRAVEKDSIRIMDGLVLEKQNHTEPHSLIDVVADSRTFGALSPLDRNLIGQIDRLARTHALKFDMSVGRGEDGGGGGGGGGGKKKKGGGHIKYVIAALLTAMGIAGPIGLKALAAIAVKALVISKIALTIAGIIALKKLFSHDHSEESSFQVHAGDHNRRNAFVVRPAAAKASSIPGYADQPSVDPYRNYNMYQYAQ